MICASFYIPFSCHSTASFCEEKNAGKGSDKKGVRTISRKVMIVEWIVGRLGLVCGLCPGLGSASRMSQCSKSAHCGLSLLSHSFLRHTSGTAPATSVLTIASILSKVSVLTHKRVPAFCSTADCLTDSCC